MLTNLHHRFRPALLAACCLAAAACGLPWGGPSASAQVLDEVDQTPSAYRCAVVVKNRTTQVPDEQVTALEDQLAALLADRGFSLIRREDVLNAVSTLSSAGPNASDDPLGSELDSMLSDNTSALRLAQNLDADYLMTASMSSFNSETRRFEGYGTDREVAEYTLRTSLAIIGRASGGAKTGDVIVASVKRPASENLFIEGDVTDGLITETARKAADALAMRASAGRVDAPEQLAAAEPFYINATMADITFPEVVRDENGDYVLTANNFPMQAFGVVVEMDGIVVGSTPGPFNVAGGLHKVRLRRDGFQDWEGTVNVREGAPLAIMMQMTPEFREQFMEQAEFFNNLKRDEKLTDAEIEVLRGYAEFLRNSEVKVGLNQINVVQPHREPFPGFMSDLSYFNWMDQQAVPASAQSEGSLEATGGMPQATPARPATPDAPASPRSAGSLTIPSSSDAADENPPVN